VKPRLQQAEANKWIAVPRSSADLASYSQDLTVSLASQELHLEASTLTLGGNYAVMGKKVLTLDEYLPLRPPPGTTVTRAPPCRWPYYLEMTVYIQASGPPLPVEVVAEGTLEPSILTATFVFGPWDKPADPKVPAKTVSFKTSWVYAAPENSRMQRCRNACRGRRGGFGPRAAPYKGATPP